jgi:hypothetical protein
MSSPLSRTLVVQVQKGILGAVRYAEHAREFAVRPSEMERDDAWTLQR